MPTNLDPVQRSRSHSTHQVALTDSYRQFQTAYLTRKNSVQSVKTDIPMQKIKPSTELGLSGSLIAEIQGDGLCNSRPGLRINRGEL
jgi:hypothetical protein